MYRRLESKPVKVEAQNAKSEGTCVCTCGTEKAVDGVKLPAASKLGNLLGEHNKING